VRKIGAMVPAYFSMTGLFIFLEATVSAPAEPCTSCS